VYLPNWARALDVTEANENNNYVVSAFEAVMQVIVRVHYGSTKCGTFNDPFMITSKSEMGYIFTSAK
jgi:hypothetical protein